MSGMLAKGSAVINLDSGVVLGKIDRVFLDRVALRLVAFTFTQGSGLFKGKRAHVVEIDDTRAIGPDAVTLDDARVVRDLVVMDGRNRGLVELDHLAELEIMTDGGTLLGRVVGLDFDSATFRMSRIHVEEANGGGERLIAAGDVVNIGAELIVVAERRTVPSDRQLAGARRMPEPLDRIGHAEDWRQAS